jgi:signal transduction histidine kinase
MLERIRRRLSMAYVGILALILILFGTIVVVIFSQQATAQQDELLRQKAEAETNSAANGSTETYAIVGATAEPDIAVVAVPPDGSVDANVLATASSGSSLGLPFGELARQTRQEESIVATTVDGPDGPVRVVSVPLFESGEMSAIIQAAQSRQVVRGLVVRLVFILVSVGLVALLLAGVGGLFISGRAMRPVRAAFHRQRAFVADASHELKTPLTLIKLNAEMVVREPTSPKNRKVIEDQLSEINRMSALVSDLLVLARLDADKLGVSRETFDLAKILAETADRFILRAAEEEILLDIEVPGELPALGDPDRTGQILAALLDNAMRFTPPGGRVTVAGHSYDGRVEASVTDTGPGISSEHLPHVFERFYRADTARRRSSGGTGLGLAIARDLAAIQGGEVVVRNAKNGGASFTLSLPAST